MYCQKCTYDLGRIASTACPECGRPFDRDDPSTFDPVAPSRRAHLVLWGVFTILVIAQPALLLAHQFVTTLPSWVVWIPIALVPIGAFAAGWCGDRYARTAAYGAASLLVVLGGFSRHERVLDTLIAELPPLIPVALLLGTFAVLIVASVTASRVGWRLHTRWVRFRTTDAGRRQDRRLRRMRQAAVGVALLLLLTGAWAVVETLRVMYATPSVRVDYGAQADALCAEAARVDVDTGHAAWSELTTVLAESHSIITNTGGSLVFRPGALGAEEPAALALKTQVLDALEAAGVLTRLDALVDGPIAIRPRSRAAGPLMAESRAELSQARLLGDVLSGSMWLELNAGHPDVAADRFIAMVGLARIISHQGRAIDRLIASEMLELAADELMHRLDVDGLPEATARRLLAALDRPPLAPVTLTLELDHLLFHDVVQRTCSDDGNGDGYLAPKTLATLPGVPPPGGPSPGVLRAFRVRFVWPSRREQVELFEELLALLLDEAALPPWSRTRDSTVSDRVEAALPDHYLLTFVSPDHRIVGRTIVPSFKIDAARTMVAIKLFTARNGRPPATLDDLVPDLLPAVPLDPFTGAPLVYRVLADGRHRTFALYSVGADRQDDGGTYHASTPTLGAMNGTVGLDLPARVPPDRDPSDSP